MTPKRLQDTVRAWLEFYQELGIEEFLIEPREMVPPTETSGARDALIQTTQVDSATTPVSDPRPPARGPQPTVPDPRPLTPVVVPARSLNLFEAEAPRKSEHETLEQI